MAGDGTKHLLDFEIGASENTETTKGLGALGFPFDGGQLPAGVVGLFGGVEIGGGDVLAPNSRVALPGAQGTRCEAVPPPGDRTELGRLFGRLRHAQGLVAGQEALQAMERFRWKTQQDGAGKFTGAGRRNTGLAPLGGSGDIEHEFSLDEPDRESDPEHATENGAGVLVERGRGADGTLAGVCRWRRWSGESGKCAMRGIWTSSAKP